MTKSDSKCRGNTAITVGVPNFCFPISLNTFRSILRSFVHRTTSHGTLGLSLGVTSITSATLLEIEETREYIDGVGDLVGNDE